MNQHVLAMAQSAQPAPERRMAARHGAPRLPDPRRLLLVSVIAMVLLAASVVATVLHAVGSLDRETVAGEIERANAALRVQVEAGIPIDENFMTRLRDEYLLTGARLATPGALRAGEVSVPLDIASVAAGATLLAWSPRRLGTGMFLELAPLRLLFSGLFIAGTGFLMHRLFVLAAELEAHRRAAQDLAGRDPLTGLGNRLAFSERLQQAFAEGPPGFALLYLDLDDFKRVNDTLGHSAGDELLCRVGERLQSFARSADLVARLGGDEFGLLCTATRSRPELEELARDVAAALSEPFRIGTSDLSIRVSIGIAVASGAARSEADLVQAADAALYRAKAKASGSFAFADEPVAGTARQAARR